MNVAIFLELKYDLSIWMDGPNTMQSVQLVSRGETKSMFSVMRIMIFLSWQTTRCAILLVIFNLVCTVHHLTIRI